MDILAANDFDLKMFEILFVILHHSSGHRKGKKVKRVVCELEWIFEHCLLDAQNEHYILFRVP